MNLPSLDGNRYCCLQVQEGAGVGHPLSPNFLAREGDGVKLNVYRGERKKKTWSGAAGTKKIWGILAPDGKHTEVGAKDASWGEKPLLVDRMDCAAWQAVNLIACNTVKK